MPRINLGPADFETFVAVAELGSFGRAAQRLSISQPAVTQRVLRLERVLGMKLFDRTTRRVSLSGAGVRLMQKAQPTIVALRSILEDFHNEASLKAGTVALGVSPSLAATVIPSILRRFMDKYPGVTIRLFDDLAGHMVERLQLDQIDFAILPKSRFSDEFNFEPLFNDQLFAVVPLDHPLARETSLSWSRFLKYPQLTHPIEAAVRNSLRDETLSDQAQPKPALEAKNISTLLAMVEAGLGVTLLPEVLRGWLNRDTVATIKISRPPLVRTIGILTRRERSLSVPAAAFLGMVRAKLKRK
jgi:DNA-binding transcriptional LysR family regulator